MLTHSAHYGDYRMKTQSRTASGITWTLESEFVRFDLVSNGMTGAQWIEYLPTLGYAVVDTAPEMLQSSLFIPTEAGTVHRVRLIRWSAFEDEKRTTGNILQLGGVMSWRRPHPEIAPLMRAAFFDDEIKEMGLGEVATIHTPILGRVLDIDTGELESAPAYDMWHEGHGFAFEE